MSEHLKGLKVAMLVSDGFEQSEMTEPKRALEKEGAIVHIVSPCQQKVKGWLHTNWGDEFPVDIELKNAQAKIYHALVLPGGVMNPDRLRIIPEAIEFIKHFIENDKHIAAICHGPWPLINAKGVKGKTLTSWSSISEDLKNAGAIWVDKEVVRDGKLVTSRNPRDIPAFNQEIIKLFAENKR